MNFISLDAKWLYQSSNIIHEETISKKILLAPVSHINLPLSNLLTFLSLNCFLSS